MIASDLKGPTEARKKIKRTLRKSTLVQNNTSLHYSVFTQYLTSFFFVLVVQCATFDNSNVAPRLLGQTSIFGGLRFIQVSFGN